MPESSIFRAYDVRGAVPNQIDEDVMERIGAAFAAHVDADRVVVGHDVRDSSPGLRDAFVAGATAAGTDVIDVGLLPYGPVLFHARGEGVPSAYITASHLPAGNNGVKFAHPDGCGYTAEENQAVEQVYRSGDAGGNGGTVTDRGVLDDYLAHLGSTVDLGAVSVLMDPGNGTGAEAGPDAFWQGGAQLEVINGDPDGSFPNRASDVTGDTLGELRERTASGGFDLGVAYDGDADRLAVVDDEGRLLSAEEVAAVAMQELLEHEEGPVAANMECSRLIDDVAAEYGNEVIRTRVGHSYLFREVVRQGAVLGVETSRHMAVSRIFPLDDGIAASLYVASVVAGMDRPLSAVVDDLPSYERDRIAFDVPEEDKFDVVDQLQTELQERYDDTDTTDGIRVEKDEGWILIRASNTSPVIRLTVEAETREGFEALKDEFSGQVEDAIAAS